MVDLFNINMFIFIKLDVVMHNLGYLNETTIYYHFKNPDVEMDYGRVSLCKDGDVDVHYFLSMWVNIGFLKFL